MSKIKPTIIILALLIVAFGLLTYFKSKPENSILIDSNNTAETSISTSETYPSASIKDKSWDVLQKYIEFAKNKNIEGVRSLSYQLTDSCKKYSTEEEKKDCDGRMDTVAYFGSSFAKKDFIYIWNDKKQIILATDFRIEENEKAISRTRSMIYFIIEGDNIKLLKFDPAKGSILQKVDLSKAEIDKKLLDFTIDSDEDGAEDYLEKCLSTSQDSTCIKTDITKKDTDLNGFWDGIELLFYK